jgi:hypothetical protein
MPNWCLNRLQVIGPAETVARFVAAAVGGNPWSQPLSGAPEEALSFHRLLAIPPAVLAAGYAAAGYDWERQHWGCKWGACHSVLAERWEGGVRYEFDTAWGPPLAFLKTASRAWPELMFQLEYEEPLAGLQGTARAERGKLHDHCDAL